MVPATERKTAANARGVAPGPPTDWGWLPDLQVVRGACRRLEHPCCSLAAKRTSGRYRISLGWLDKFAGIAATEV